MYKESTSLVMSGSSQARAFRTGMVDNLTSRELVLRIKREVDMNYFDQLHISHFARQYNINPNYLSELFNKILGTNFVKYLTSIRLEKARQYLKYTDFSTSKIAELIGYGDRGYFSRQFTKQCTISPNAYRKEYFSQMKECNEEYVYVAVFRNDPLMIEQDMVGLQYFSNENKVKAKIEAPEEFDIELGVHILENVINRHPAGIMVCASDPIYIPYINQAIDNGIPTITVDCDAPTSNRLATVCSNWSLIGETMAAELAASLKAQGKVAVLNMSASSNMRTAYASFCKTMEEFPGINVLGEYDDSTNAKFAEEITKNLLVTCPELAGIAGFDSKSAIGACEAIRKAGLRGHVKVVSIDMTSAHLALLRDGYVEMLLGQKRSLFTYYGGKLLYDCNHSKLEIAKSIDSSRFYNIPQFVDTGFIKITRENYQEIVGYKQKE